MKENPKTLTKIQKQVMEVVEKGDLPPEEEPPADTGEAPVLE